MPKGVKHPPWTSEDCPARKDPSIPKKGGRSYARKCAIRRSMREWAKVIGDTDAGDAAFGGLTLGGKVVKAQFDAALEGDTKAAEFLAKLTGELTEKTDLRIVPHVIDDIPAPESPGTPQ